MCKHWTPVCFLLTLLSKYWVLLWSRDSLRFSNRLPWPNQRHNQRKRAMLMPQCLLPRKRKSIPQRDCVAWDKLCHSDICNNPPKRTSNPSRTIGYIRSGQRDSTQSLFRVAPPEWRNRYWLVLFLRACIFRVFPVFVATSFRRFVI
jgi:hypothetical protein